MREWNRAERIVCAVKPQSRYSGQTAAFRYHGGADQYTKSRAWKASAGQKKRRKRIWIRFLQTVKRSRRGQCAYPKTFGAGKELSAKEKEWRTKAKENDRALEEKQNEFHRQQSRLESLKNIAERYDGYGNSIRKVMEQKEHNPGLLGVVSDLIQVDKKYEIAIETALGGNIQNIVTEDEATAKKMIAFLKQNRFGRATFLPLTSVSARKNPKNEAALKEPQVIGIASQLVKCEQKYEEVAAYLLGRVLVADSIDHAIALAKKNHYSLHIVTLEGEYLSPGGSMTGGAFKNSSICWQDAAKWRNWKRKRIVCFRRLRR